MVASSNAFAMEKLRTMRSFGATVDLIRSSSCEISADLIPSIIRHAEEVCAQSDSIIRTSLTTATP